MEACDQGHFVSAYMDGELSPEERLRFRKHLKQCTQCQEAVNDLRQVDDALRRQHMQRSARFSDCSESIADSVQRDLTRTGEFSRARRLSWLRRHRRQLVISCVGLAMLAVVSVLAMHVMAGRGGGRNGDALNGGAPEARRLSRPELFAVMAEAEHLLLQLQTRAAEPGMARELHLGAIRSGIRERLLIAESNSLLRDTSAVKTMQLALAHLVTLPEDNIERSARRLAAAIEESRLVERSAQFRHYDGAVHAMGDEPGAPAASTSATVAANGREAINLGGLRSDEALAAQLAGNHEEAVELWRKRLEVTRDEVDRAELLVSISRSLLALGRYDQAVAELGPLIEEQPQHRLADEALFVIGEAHRLSDRRNEADVAYGRLRSDYGSSPLAAVALLHQGRMAEEQGSFDVALNLYKLLEQSLRRLPAMADEAESRRRFIIENRDGGFVALGYYRQAELQHRHPTQQTEAFITLVRLANGYRSHPIGDDALLLLVRMHLAQGDEAAAEQAFRRLMELPPASLPQTETQSIALAATGWLLKDASAAVDGSKRIFVELTGYNKAEALNSPTEADGRCQMVFVSDVADAASERRLLLRVEYWRAGADEQAFLPSLGLARRVTIETANPLLREEIERILRQVDAALAVLDRAATQRQVPSEASDS